MSALTSALERKNELVNKGWKFNNNLILTSPDRKKRIRVTDLSTMSDNEFSDLINYLPKDELLE